MQYISSLAPVLRYSVDGDENGIDTINLTTVRYVRSAQASGGFVSPVCQTYVSLSTRKQLGSNQQERPVLATVALSDGRTMYVQQQATATCGGYWNKDALQPFVDLAKTTTAYDF